MLPHKYMLTFVLSLTAVDITLCQCANSFGSSRFSGKNSSSKIVPGDTANVKMLFRYSEVLLGNKFSKFEDMDWGLIFSFYPIKYRIKLV